MCRITNCNGPMKDKIGCPERDEWVWGSSLEAREGPSEEIKFKLKFEGGAGVDHWTVGREWHM